MLKLKLLCVYLISIFLLQHLIVSPALKAQSSQIEIPATHAADYIHAVIQANRSIYSKYIVERLGETVSLKATENWKTENTLPLPAQFLMTSAKRVNSKHMGINYHLMSLWPINKKNKYKTPEEKLGLEKVALNPDHPYRWVVSKNGQLQFNAIYPDRAITGSCAHCHNRHPNSPKKNFKRGDVMGGIQITFPLSKSAKNIPISKQKVALPLVADYIHAILEADRTLYARHVVNRLQEKNVIYASENWWKENTLLLPAQFLLNASELIQNMRLGLSYKLISSWPINPNNKAANEFERMGLKKVVSKPHHKHVGTVQRGNQMYFQAIYPDIAVVPSCVTCHNEHSKSPRKDFKLYDVIGGIVISIPLKRVNGMNGTSTNGK